MPTSSKTDEFSEKFQGGGHFQSKNLCCKIWTFKQGYLTMKLIQRGLFRLCFSTIVLIKIKTRYILKKAVPKAFQKYKVPATFEGFVASLKTCNICRASRSIGTKFVDHFFCQFRRFFAPPTKMSCITPHCYAKYEILWDDDHLANGPFNVNGLVNTFLVKETLNIFLNILLRKW